MTWDITHPFPVTLICPACRIAPDGSVAPSMLHSASGGEALSCPTCGAEYPVRGGIPCVPALTAEDDEHLVATYVLAHFPDGTSHRAADPLRENETTMDVLEDWVSRHKEGPVGNGWFLEAGCGPGGLLRRLARHALYGAMGLDLRWSMLSAAADLASGRGVTIRFRVEGDRKEAINVFSPKPAWADRVRFVHGDVMAPPFEAEAFPLVAACSLLDTVSDPLMCLGQLDALLAPGGLLLLCTPYRWDARVTPTERWWDDGARVVRQLLAGEHPELPHLGYDLIEHHPRLSWVLPGDDRLSHRYLLDSVLARKRR